MFSHYHLMTFNLNRDVVCFCTLLGPEQVSTCEVPIVFGVRTFWSQMNAFLTAWTYPKTHQTWNIGHIGKKCYNLLSLGISTTGWRYNWLLYCTFNNFIFTHDIGHGHFHVPFFFFFFFSQIREMLQTYFFKPLPADFTDLHKTLLTASVDPPYKGY